MSRDGHLSSVGDELEEEAGAGRADMAAVQAVGVPIHRNVAPAHGREAKEGVLAGHSPALALRHSGHPCTQATDSRSS